MAFSFSNAVSGGGGFGGTGQTSSAPTIRDGPELQEISTDQLGFVGLNGEAQLRLISTPWPADNLPPPTASLLAVASSKGLLAAAGPEELILTSTNTIRETLRSKPKDDNKVRDFEPQIRIQRSRLSHVAFSADDDVLVTSSQAHGGLDAFQIANFANGQTDPALQLPTEGKALRALVPNPATASAELFALVTVDGELLVADLKTASLRSGAGGSVLKTGVSCVAWSNKGKALVAGQADGTATQMKPDGSVMAVIPKSTSVADGSHVSSICWLENDTFLIIYAPSDVSGGMEPSEYYIVQREPKTTNFIFHKLPEVVPAFGMERLPACHFITRLRSFPPHIQDLLILASTTGSETGMISLTDAPLDAQMPVTNDFTFTTISSDARRAILPFSDSGDTSPVGMALDLSSDEKVPNPIPTEGDILETDGPVPNLLMLNNEGILLAWSLIYNDSIIQKTLFSGIADLKTGSDNAMQSQPVSQPEPAKANPFSAASSTFGQSGFGSANTFGKPAASTFGSNPPAPGVDNSSQSAFGQASTIGGAKSAWTSSGFGSNSGAPAGGSAFGQPAFGAPAALGSTKAPAFGAPAALGSKPSPFGQPSNSATPAFGKPSMGTQGASAFGSATDSSSPFAAKASGPSGFASFSKSTTGFGAPTGNNSEAPSASPFGQAKTDNVFGKPADSAFGQKNEGFSGFGAKQSGFSSFGRTKVDAPQSSFGTTGGFKLDSTFKNDGTAKDDLPKPAQTSGFGFATGFEELLSEPQPVTSPTHDKEEDMSDGEDAVSEPGEVLEKQPATRQSQPLVTPPSTLGAQRATPAPSVSSLFGNTTDQNDAPQTSNVSSGWSFGQVPSTTPKDRPSQPTSTTPKDPPAPTNPMFGTTAFGTTPAVVQKSQPKSIFGTIEKPSRSPTPKIKQEPPSDDEAVDVSSIPEAPLPPETTSKTRYVSGDTSASSSSHSKGTDASDDAPLPPDFVPANKSAAPSELEQQGLPSEGSDLSSEYEGSQDDDEEGESPSDDLTEVQGEQSENIQTSPESSFKSGDRSQETSPTGGLFTKVSTTTNDKPKRPLFGEVGITAPMLPPPIPQQSPRSPSPVRRMMPTEALRADPARSVSAPAHPRSVIAQRKAEYAQSQLSIQAGQTREDELERQRAQQAQNAQRKAEEEARQLQELEDGEDERLRQEINADPTPEDQLDDFVTYQPRPTEDTSKSGIPAQIERLYQDLNSMVDSLGINARSLSCYMLYQQSSERNESWPGVLTSDTPGDALNDEWILSDIDRLREGQEVLTNSLHSVQVSDLTHKLQSCQDMLTTSLFSLRQKLTAIRKSLNTAQSQSSTNGITSSLSAEQASIQHDLRKSSALVSSKISAVEEGLALLRSRLADSTPQEQQKQRNGQVLFRSGSQKKPTVEAVMNAVTRMTGMAEKKSFDVDVLESQMRKMDLLGASESNGTPQKNGRSEAPAAPRTPGSAKSTKTVYHTPEEKLGANLSSRNGFRASGSGCGLKMGAVSNEDKTMWTEKARKKREVKEMLRGILSEKRERERSMGKV